MLTPKLPTATPASAKRDPQTYAIIGAALTVYNELGHGFLESVYQDALQLELNSLRIPHAREHPIQISYRGTRLKSVYHCDFLCFDDLIVELKALQRLTPIEDAQVIHYLKATGFHKALLINFGAPSLEHKRLIHGPAEFFEPTRQKQTSPQNL